MSSLETRSQTSTTRISPAPFAVTSGQSVAVYAGVIDQILRFYRPLAGRKRARAECLALIRGKGPEVVLSALGDLPVEWADHAIASIYAVLMPRVRRKTLGAYFTPPHLVDHLLHRMSKFGLSIGRDTVEDPAAGGAAFLVPLARRMVAIWRQAGKSDGRIITLLRENLLGTEIDAGLADIANALLRKMLIVEWRFRVIDVDKLTIVRRGNAISRCECSKSAKHEVGNPPYRRLSAAEHIRMHRRFSDISSGRMNLYAMFMRRALDEIPAGGLIGHVVPASFLGGPEFATFRTRLLELAEILVVDLIDQRSNVFVDATQDACFVVLRRRAKEFAAADALASSGVLHADGEFTPAADMRLTADGSAWNLPGPVTQFTATLADWGYRATVGYLVPHRQRARLHERPAKGRYPLIWARSVGQDGSFVHTRGLSRQRLGWVCAPEEATYVIRQACVVMQRTSSRDQQRRVVAAAIPKDFVRQHGGIIGENHVLFLIPTRADAHSPEALAAALNNPLVSIAMNRVCGSASIPLGALQQIKLPEGVPRSCDEIETM